MLEIFLVGHGARRDRKLSHRNLDGFHHIVCQMGLNHGACRRSAGYSGREGMGGQIRVEQAGLRLEVVF